jgi:hypothetical protein
LTFLPRDSSKNKTNPLQDGESAGAVSRLGGISRAIGFLEPKEGDHTNEGNKWGDLDLSPMFQR